MLAGTQAASGHRNSPLSPCCPLYLVTLQQKRGLKEVTLQMFMRNILPKTEKKGRMKLGILFLRISGEGVGNGQLGEEHQRGKGWRSITGSQHSPAPEDRFWPSSWSHIPCCAQIMRKADSICLFTILYRFLTCDPRLPLPPAWGGLHPPNKGTCSPLQWEERGKTLPGERLWCVFPLSPTTICIPLSVPCPGGWVSPHQATLAKPRHPAASSHLTC